MNANKLYKKKFSILLIFFITSIFTFSSLLVPSKDLESGKLTNGINYYILKNYKPEKRATITLVVKSGSLNEEDNQRGLAHFLEHMAFNGTKNYPKNDMIKYLQSLGLSFGGDLNAYTSFNETAYKLKLPTTEEKDLDEAFKVLNEWAFNITLNQTDINEEKNIVIEEWRSRQGLTERIGTLRRKALFGDSRFFYRNPIGLTSIINNANSDLLKSYYKKWYTPDKMAIIAVGDFSPELIKKYINKYFANIENSNSGTIEEIYRIPKTKSDFIIFKDKELTSTSLSMWNSIENIPVIDDDSFRNILIREYFFSILNSRFNIIAQKKSSPIMGATIGYSNITDLDGVISLESRIKENQAQDAFKLIIDTLKIISKYGPFESELNDEKIEFISKFKNLVANRNSLENDYFTDEILNTYLFKDTYLNPSDTLDKINEISQSISVEDIKKYALNYFESNKVKFFSFPEKSLKIPSKEVFLSIEKGINNSEVKNIDLSSNATLKVPEIKKGNIISEKLKNNSPFDYTEFTLSNGIKVTYKKTDFDKDKIILKFFKTEGNSTDNKTEYLNGYFAPYMLIKSGLGNLNYQELEKFMKGKNFSLTPYINDYEHGVTLITDKENLNISTDALITMLINKRFDDNIFETLKNNFKEKIENRKNSPRSYFSDETQKLIYGNNYRKNSPESKDLDLITKDEVLKLYNKKFSNFYGYNLLVLGSIDSSDIKEILENKISALPTDKNDINYIPQKIILPQGKNEKQISKGEDEKALVKIIYPLKDSYSNDNRILSTAFSNILDIVLIEKIRESLGDVYSISSNSTLEYMNFGDNYLSIGFYTNPLKATEVASEVRNTVTEVIEGKYENSKILDIINNYKLTYETNLKKNEFWISYLTKKIYLENNNYHILNPEEYKNLVTKENISKFSSNLMNKDNYIQTILNPNKIIK